MIKKPAEIELGLLKNALFFLSEEWLLLAEQNLAEGQETFDLDSCAFYLGKANAYYQSAAAIQLLIHKVETDLLDEMIAPLSIAREVVRSTTEED